MTGAGGTIAKGLVPRLLASGHEVVASDVVRLEVPGALAFHQVDVQHGFGLESAAAGCDLVVHTPAWHGIHWGEKTEADFWRLNVDGTFWAFQAAKAAGIERFVFLSSQAWHGHYDKYGFTKRVGEELCEYHRRRSGVRYVAVRPADLTPWGEDWINRYGARLLAGGVDREDVVDAVALSVERLARPLAGEPEGIVLDALRPNAYGPGDLEGWESDPAGTLERIFPGAGRMAAKYAMRLPERPGLTTSFSGWEEVGYAPTRHFGTFLEELRRVDESGGETAVRARRCEY